MHTTLVEFITICMDVPAHGCSLLLYIYMELPITQILSHCTWKNASESMRTSDGGSSDVCDPAPCR